jgi:hypothetical protein
MRRIQNKENSTTPLNEGELIPNNPAFILIAVCTKFSANNISKTQVLKKMILRKAVSRAVLQDDGYTQSYITLWAITEGCFTNEWLKYSALQPTPLVVVAD